MKKVIIMMQVGDYFPVRVETCDRAVAQARIDRYYREDKYEAEVEGYGFPNGLPRYYIEEV